jgi:hypothetical protein
MGNGAVADGGDPNGLSAVGQLAEDSIGANPQRIQAAKLPTTGVAGERFTLKKAKHILNRVYERPAQRE